MTILGLDYETYSDLDIRKVGGARYVRDPSTEILMLSWSIDRGEVSLWQPHLGRMPAELRDAMTDPHVEKWAFNAGFEEGISTHALPRYEPGVVVPRGTWRCSMYLAYGLSFMGSLDKILQQIGFPEEMWKLAEGKKLIQRFSKPQPANHKTRRWGWWNDPDQWERFGAYCVQDNVVERGLREWCQQFDPISNEEWQIWQMDQDINNRGIPVDRVLTSTARGLVGYRKGELKKEMKAITGLDNPTSNQQLSEWIAPYNGHYGLNLTDMQAPTLEKNIETCTDPVLKRVLQCKRWVAQTATQKFDSVDLMACEDDTLKGMFVAGGASRTRRWASRGINLQNLKRPIVDDMDAWADALKSLALDHYLAEHELMDLLAASVRAAIAAPRGRKLVVSDLGSIESRVLGWVADCPRINNTFAIDKDTYKDFATELYHIPYEEVTKQQRNFSKPPTLGCGYQLGAKGLVEYADSMGVTMTLDEALIAVDTFRRIFPEVKQMWYWLVETVSLVTTTGGRACGYKVDIHRDASFLYITLPSGRRLAYYKPEMRPDTIRWKDRLTGEMRSRQVMNFTYMGFNRFTNKWGRISTHGGGLTENIVQAIARDILAYHMRLAVQSGHDVVGHVHDEIITVSPDEWAQARLQHLEDLMRISTPWAPDLLLDAEGYVGQHYRKD